MVWQWDAMRCHRMPARVLLILLATLMTANVSARAGLRWDRTTITLHPGEGEQQAVGHFIYRNVGAQALRFTKIRPSCGCTTVEPAKLEIAPGETGEITAKFTIGDRVGLQIKTVSVTISDPTLPVTVLTLKVVLPELLSVHPTFVSWTKAEVPQPKFINVHSSQARSVQHLTISSSSSAFRTDVRQVGDRDFVIAVTPRDTMHPDFASLTIKSDTASKLFYANARVIPDATQPR